MKHYEHPVYSIAQSGLEYALQRHLDEKELTNGDGSIKFDCLHDHKATIALTHILDVVDKGQNVPEEVPGHISCDKHEWGVLKLYWAVIEARFEGNKKKLKMLLQRLKFSPGDVGWLDALVEYIETFDKPSGHRIPYRRWKSLDDFVVRGFEFPCKLALIGDWCTGTAIAKNVLKRAMKHEPDALVHMGDVYYAGSEEQYRRKFHDLVNLLAIKDGQRIPVYNLAGNHDMYSGGDAYYRELDAINASCPKGMRQGASYFALEIGGGRWQILGCDTAYHDHDPFTVNSEITSVTHHEQDWLEHQVRRSSKFGGRNILLSHHQPYSAFERIGSLGRKSPLDFWVNPKLLEMYKRLDASGTLAAWFWGHEHRFAVYGEYAGIPSGRCIGHGAVPMLTEENPYQLANVQWKNLPFDLIGMLRGAWRPNTFKGLYSLASWLVKGEVPEPPQLARDSDGVTIKISQDCEGIMYRHGFVILEFTEQAATAAYYDDVDEQPMFREEL